MAYVAQQVPDFQQNQFGRKDDTTPNPVPPQTGGSSGGGQGGTGTAPGFASPTQFGSNAAKLSDYLNANKDQVGQFGQQVAGNLTQGYNDTVGAINQGTQQFGQQVNQGYAPFDSSTVNRAATDPAGFVKDPNNVSKFQSMYNDQYTGPQNFEGSSVYSNVNDQVNKAVENAGLTSNAAGLGTYLNTNMGANDNTEGMRSLDTALLLGNKDSSKAISDAAAPYQNLQTYLSGQTQTADVGVQTAKQAADQTRQTTQNQFTGQNGVIPTFQNDLTGRVSAARTAASDKTTKEMADIKAGKFTPDELADFKADPAKFAALQNISTSLLTDYDMPFDLSNYFSGPQAPEKDITPETLGTADDFSKSAALNQLTGQDLSSFLNPTNAGLAGTAPSVLSSFDLGKASDDASSSLANADTHTLTTNFNPSGPINPSNWSQVVQAQVFTRNVNRLNDQQRAWLAAWNKATSPTNTLQPGTGINPPGTSQPAQPPAGGGFGIS